MRPLSSDLLIFLDRKSTRLNSSHSQISYAVFCLKKKKPLHDAIRFTPQHGCHIAVIAQAIVRPLAPSHNRTSTPHNHTCCHSTPSSSTYLARSEYPRLHPCKVKDGARCDCGEPIKSGGIYLSTLARDVTLHIVEVLSGVFITTLVPNVGFIVFFFKVHAAHRVLPSSPTRPSSD